MLNSPRFTSPRSLRAGVERYRPSVLGSRPSLDPFTLGLPIGLPIGF